MQGYKLHHTIKSSKLKLIRIQKGMKQSDLSKASGVPLKSIGNYEQLRRDINKAQADIVYRLANALGCSMEDLMELDKIE
jgi:transcriptional regulator with XRE-family HTH domain